MRNSWKIYILAIVSFLVGTSEFVIAGILDMLASDIGVSVAAAGQLITVYSLAYAIGTPILCIYGKNGSKKAYAVGFGIIFRRELDHCHNDRLRHAAWSKNYFGCQHRGIYLILENRAALLPRFWWALTSH